MFTSLRLCLSLCFFFTSYLFNGLVAPAHAQTAPQATSLAVGSDNLMHLLWNNPDSTVSLWRAGVDGSFLNNTYGPYQDSGFSPWTANSNAVGPDNKSRLLWNRNDGAAFVWNVDDASGAYTSNFYGPYSGWTATAMAAGPDNVTRLLWNNVNGSIALWDQNNTTGAFTPHFFGPYQDSGFSPWTAIAVAVGSDNKSRLLWNRSDGAAIVWSVDDASGAFTNYPAYGPYSGWSAIALAVDASNAPRILWYHPSDGTIALWKVASDGSFTPNFYGIPSGFTPKALAGGSDGNVRLLWTKPDGTVEVWVIAADNTYTVLTNFVVPPSNLTVQGYWSNGQPTDILSWNAVPGAVSYNIYQYDTLIGSVPSNSYMVPTAKWLGGLTYAVTAVVKQGTESIPSNIVRAQGGNNPNQPPTQSGPPPVPTALTVTPEWNVGKPRIRLAWQGSGDDATYNVYRDGQKIASGIWGLTYLDTAVQPGETHSYAISGVTNWLITPESAVSSPSVTTTALTAAPAPSGSQIQITGVQSNDDSVIVSFAAVPGAVDYRAHTLAHPGIIKYSGGSLSIEMNGLNPASPPNIVVEAVDKLGPFQKMDGAMGAGMMSPGMIAMDAYAINGQGDPSNVPNVLATSGPVSVTCQPFTLAGSQAFFDAFRNEAPFVQQPNPNVRAGSFYGDPANYQEYANNNWAIRDYGGDIANTKIFTMSNHFMDTLYDGGSPWSNIPIHNNDASLVMMPKATADISGGRVLHVTFEVDSHFSLRRWCEVQLAQAGDLLIEPGNIDTGSGPLRFPTQSGTELRWRIDGEFHKLILYRNVNGVVQQTFLIDTSWNPGNERYGPAARIRYDGLPLANGTAQDLDKRHRFDLYLSQTHYRLMESGQIIKDADFPAGLSLSFSNVQPYFVHQLYHTGNDRPEQIGNGSANAYWYNYRPWADERHWDNMGFSVLNAFPN